MLIDHADAAGVRVTASQLERWRAGGLLPRNTQRPLGRGRGSTSVPAPGAAELVQFLGREARAGRRPHDLALRAFDAGLSVPDSAVRAALAATISRIRLQAEDELSAVGADRSDWAWEVAERELGRHRRGVLMPRRMRRIDERLAKVLSWSHESIARYDRGPAVPDPMSARDVDALSVATMLGGGEELGGPVMAAMLRAMSPDGAALPIASMLEYEDNPDLTQIGDEAGFTMVPAGDMREALLRVVEQAEPAELRLAWEAAGAQRGWALQLTADVEAELDSGQLGPAALLWCMGSTIGLHRLTVRTVLRERRPTLASRASDTVMLLYTARALRVLRQAIPDGQFGLLPVIVPQYMHELIGVMTPPGFDPLQQMLGATANPTVS